MLSSPPWICLRLLCLTIGLASRIDQVGCGAGLTVTPSPGLISSSVGSLVTLRCMASHSPSICLWRTPYQAIYTVGGGRVWEEGRLTSSLLASSNTCGLTIDKLEARDAGVWQCEVGSVVKGDFTTTTASTTVTVTESVEHDTSLELLRLLGEETVLPCSIDSISSPGRRSLDFSSEKLCRWTTPYNRTYSLKDEEYEERGRLQRSRSENCNLRVASLQARDQGQWLCQVGHSGTHNLQAKAIILKLESPLKLSAPTSILQHADERATLVCHANKEYDNCQWTTPYQVTYEFDNNEHRSHEQGRLEYFGFSSMDCGIVIRGLGTRDSGGWTCRVGAKVQGKLSNSTDIVRLFVEPKKFEEVPSEEFGSDYNLDYKTTEYDAFDYVNGDFDKVTNTDSVGTLAITTESTIDEQFIVNSGTITFDRLSPQTTASPIINNNRFNPRSQQNHDQNLPVFPTGDQDLNSRELEFLERISGSRIDNRPIRIDGEEHFGSRQSNNPEKRFQFGQVKIEIEQNNSQDLQGNSNIRNQNRNPDQVRRVHDLIESDKTLRISQKDVNSNETPNNGQFERKDESNTKTDERRLLQTQREQHHFQELQRRREEAKQKEIEHKNNILFEEQRRKALEDQRQRDLEEKRHQELQEKRQQERKALEDQRQRDLEEKKQIEIQERRQQERKALEDQRKRDLEEKRQLELQKRRQQDIRDRRQKEIEEKRQKDILQLRQKLIEEKRQNDIEERRLNDIEERRLEEIEEKRLMEIEERRLKEIEKNRLKEIEEKRLKKIEERRLKEIEDRRLKEIEEKRLKEIEERRLKEIEESRLKKIEEKRLKEIEEKRLKEIEENRLKEIEERRLKERRLKEIQERRLKEIQERRLKEIEEKRAKRIKERKQLQEDRLKELEEKKEFEERRRKLNAKRRKQQEEEKRLKENEQRKQIELEERRQKEIEKKKDAEEKQKLEEVRKIEEEKIAEEKKQKEIEEKIKEEKRRRLIEKRIEQHMQQELQRKEQERLLFLLRLEEEKKEERKRKAEEVRKLELAKRLEQEKKKFEDKRRERIRQAEFEQKIEAERKKVRSRLKEEDKKEFENRRVQQQTERKGEQTEDQEKADSQARIKELEDKEIKEEQIRLKNQKHEDELHQRKIIEENLKNQELQAERERKLQSEREQLTLEREKLEEQQAELRRQQDLLELSKKQQQEQESTQLQNNPIERDCVISPWPEAGNITCPAGLLSRGRYSVPHGSVCSLECQPGFVSLERREATCSSGSWDSVLQCVRPGAMLVVGGRSDTYGVLSSVELLTSGGVCRGAVPSIPAMRWKMVAATLGGDTVLVCGGINFLGDPKTTCWALQLQPPPGTKDTFTPSWREMEGLSVPRDAAAWAAEGGSLFVMGGSLGPLSGYTASVEVWDGESWEVGPNLSSSRASHCAVGLGNGSIIVTGGYGALRAVQRLDISSRTWTDLPSLNPLRAQHGCALVELDGRRGVMVAGGDSGGTRLNDVRFLALDPAATWTRLADLNTARWGRPSIGVIGGRITVVGGWDGVKALSSVEYYDEKSETWQTSRISRLSTDRRWAAATQINTKLFPKCVSKQG